MFGPGFMQRRQVWSVSEFQLVVGIACVATSITHFISLELLWGPTIPTFFTVVRRKHLSLSYMDHIARIGGHKDCSIFGS
jgi:hypothetical protein